MKTLLSAQDLVVGYHQKPILPPVTFQVRRGEVWGIIGSNGSGKSTLLTTLMGLRPPVGGKVLRGEGLNLGYVPQRSDLDLAVPARVLDVVRDGVDRGWTFLNPLYPRRNRHQVQQAMDDAHVSALAHQQFSTLSEGQKQRVMIARALAGNPALLVLDEPTSAMDAGAERTIFELLGELRSTRDLGILLVSHHWPVLGEFATNAIYVDRDQSFVKSGDIQAVCACEPCVTRYGNVLGGRNHG